MSKQTIIDETKRISTIQALEIMKLLQCTQCTHCTDLLQDRKL